MNMRRIEIGIYLLSIGLVWLMFELGVLNFSIVRALENFWPAILVVIGVNMIFIDNPYIRVATWLLFLAGLILTGFYAGNIFRSPWRGIWKTVSTWDLYKYMIV